MSDKTVIRLFRCMECGSLSNRVQQVEVVRFETMLSGEPQEYATNAVICDACIGRDYGEPA